MNLCLNQMACPSMPDGGTTLSGTVYAPTQAECRRLLEDAVTRALRRLVKEPSE